MILPLEKLQKYLKLEADRGCDNRAIVGGLEKIIPLWEPEARLFHLNETFIQAIVNRLNNYQSQSPEERENSLQEIMAMIKTEKGNSSTGAEVENRPPARPAQTASSGEKSPQEKPYRNPSRPARVFPDKNGPHRSESSNPRDVRSFTSLGLEAPLTVLPGIGPSYAKKLAGIDLYTLGDLLYYFPRRYDDYSKLKPINRIQYRDELSVIGTVQSVFNRPIRNGQSVITEVVIGDGTGTLRVTWFNSSWIANRLAPGTQVIFAGKVDMYLGRLVMNNPEWELVEKDHLNTNRIVPVYPLTSGLTQRYLRRLMYQAIPYWAPRVPDYLSDDIRQDAELISLPTALVQAHFPDSLDNLIAARNRLAFDEIFLLQLGVLCQKRNWENGSARVFQPSAEWFGNLLENLPFPLTNAQRQVISDLQADLSSGKPMNRLLQGDVGSGKTIVAALAIAMVTHEGAQAAMMAPTSILAEQHYRNLSRIFANPENPESMVLQPGEICLLVGDTPEAQKQSIREGLANGSIKLVIGTHALIEDPIVFDNLQIAVVDEQHRFGVEQRSLLRAKGQNPHLLVMTATPIPRSLALTIYGDLNLSIMNEMPVGRLPIETHVLHPLERERAYQLIRHEIEQGHQAFIIYPLVEENGEVEDEGKAAVEEYGRLQSEIFPDLKIGLMHGRMRPEEKDNVMAQFRDKNFNILVSTSVVEVGVDIPNATVILIEAANRFGLAQLHQFRGRVGRGSAQSFCLLIPDKEDAIENQRLTVMVNTNDGFVLAEQDLQQRGPGQFLGTRQSGFSELKMSKLTDLPLIEKGRRQAIKFFDQNPNFLELKNEYLNKMYRRFWGGGQGDVS